MAFETKPAPATGQSAIRAISAPVLAGMAAFAVATLITLVGQWADVPVSQIVRDPAAEFGYPAYGGILSHLGVALLTGTAAITAFAALLSPKASRRRLLLAASLFTLILTLDDLFLLHEGLPDRWEVVIFLLYGLGLAALTWAAARTFPDRDWRGLLIVLAFLGLSAVIDMTPWRGPAKSALEDFAKFAGYAAWLAFWAGAAKAALERPRAA